MGGPALVAERLAQALASNPALLDLLAAAIETGTPSEGTAMPWRLKGAAKQHRSAPEEECAHADMLVPLAAVKDITGLGKTTIYALVRKGEFPAPYKPGGMATRWSLAEVLAWRRELKPVR